MPSPIVSKTHSLEPSKMPVETMSFAEALKLMVLGKKITKIEWDNPENVAWLEDEYLMIRIDGVNHRWILRRVDIIGEDYVEV